MNSKVFFIGSPRKKIPFFNHTFRTVVKIKDKNAATFRAVPVLSQILSWLRWGNSGNRAVITHGTCRWFIFPNYFWRDIHPPIWHVWTDCSDNHMLGWHRQSGEFITDRQRGEGPLIRSTIFDIVYSKSLCVNYRSRQSIIWECRQRRSYVVTFLPIKFRMRYSRVSIHGSTLMRWNSTLFPEAMTTIWRKNRRLIVWTLNIITSTVHKLLVGKRVCAYWCVALNDHRIIIR